MSSLLVGCQGKAADVAFVLDASTSIWNPDFNKQLKFVTAITSAFHINPNITRVGVLTFGDHSEVQFRLSDYETENEVMEAVHKINQSNGDTNTASALLTMTTDIFADKYSRPGVVKIGVVITDGLSNFPAETALAAKMARETGIQIFAVGVGRHVERRELEAIASSPASQFVFRVDNYKALSKLRKLLAIKACEGKLYTNYHKIMIQK